ncbi:ApaG domain, partial [Achromobacter sp. UBA5777]
MKPYDLSVSVSPRFVPEQSDPGEQQFVFAYTVRITNTGEHPAQVISRHWIITDG